MFIEQGRSTLTSMVDLGGKLNGFGDGRSYGCLQCLLSLVVCIISSSISFFGWWNSSWSILLRQCSNDLSESIMFVLVF